LLGLGYGQAGLSDSSAIEPSDDESNFCGHDGRMEIDET
jgi:hypothetical protein